MRIIPMQTHFSLLLRASLTVTILSVLRSVSWVFFFFLFCVFFLQSLIFWEIFLFVSLAFLQSKLQLLCILGSVYFFSFHARPCFEHHLCSCSISFIVWLICMCLCACASVLSACVLLSICVRTLSHKLIFFHTGCPDVCWNSPLCVYSDWFQYWISV